MPTAHLTDRSIVTVDGADAEPFLQNILTVDLDRLGAGEAKPGALLSPQGKILFDFLISRSAETAFRLDCPQGSADDFLRRLTLYRLRAKVEIAKREQGLVGVSWRIDSAASQTESTASRDESCVTDTRFPPDASVIRAYADLPADDATPADWHAFRVACGVPESGDDFALGEAFPHDALLDEMDGVGFKKGCYVGQEVVSRMQHRGTARRRVLIAGAATDLPPPGTPVSAGGRSVGTLGSVAGRQALAMLRIDRVKDAMDSGQPVTAGDAAITLSIPAFARFTWPADAAADAEG